MKGPWPGDREGGGDPDLSCFSSVVVSCSFCFNISISPKMGQNRGRFGTVATPLTWLHPSPTLIRAHRRNLECPLPPPLDSGLVPFDGNLGTAPLLPALQYLTRPSKPIRGTGPYVFLTLKLLHQFLLLVAVSLLCLQGSR